MLGFVWFKAKRKQKRGYLLTNMTGSGWKFWAVQEEEEDIAAPLERERGRDTEYEI